jgi:hypothetical protein
MNEATYNIEFVDNGMIVRSDLTTVVEGNERRMSEEIGKLVYQLMGETNKIKLTIKVEKG